AVADVPHRRGRMRRPEGADPASLAGTRAARAARVGMAGGDAPGAALVPEPVRVVGEARAVELLQGIEVGIEAVGEHPERDAAGLAPGDERRTSRVELDVAQERLELA